MSIEILDNGIEAIPVYAGSRGDYPAGELGVSRILKWCETEGKKIWFDKSQKRHVRFFAQQAFIHAKMARDRFRQIVKMRKRKRLKGTPKSMYGLLLDATHNAFTAGYYFHCLKIVNAEQDAMAGSKQRQAAQGKHRKPKKGSSTEAMLKIPDYLKMPSAGVIKLLPGFDPGTLRRQHARLKAKSKNSGQ